MGGGASLFLLQGSGSTRLPSQYGIAVPYCSLSTGLQYHTAVSQQHRTAVSCCYGRICTASGVQYWFGMPVHQCHYWPRHVGTPLYCPSVRICLGTPIRSYSIASVLAYVSGEINRILHAVCTRTGAFCPGSGRTTNFLQHFCGLCVGRRGRVGYWRPRRNQFPKTESQYSLHHTRADRLLISQYRTIH